MKVAGDAISGRAVADFGAELCVQFGDSRPNRSRPAHFVMDNNEQQTTKPMALQQNTIWSFA